MSHACFSQSWAFAQAATGVPSAAAGKPILGAIEADGLDGVAVLIVR
jgi:putative IMPACT (imprinted ancient) family translation regulator